MEANDANANPYAEDPVAKEAIKLLVEFMTQKVNPKFTEKDAWEFYIKNRPLIDEEDQEIANSLRKI